MNRRSPEQLATHSSRKVQQAAFALGVILIIACFYWTGGRLMVAWERKGGYYGHGWLVPIVTAALLWFRREQIATCPRKSMPWASVLVVLSLLLHLAGVATFRPVISGVAMIGFFAGVILTLFGRAMLSCTLLPILFLAFMVPLPDAIIKDISFNMKLAAAGIATGVVDFIGITVIRDGSYVLLAASRHIPEMQRLVVDDVCSGLKYLISLTAFGALYAFGISQLQRLWHKGALFLLSIPISFAANVFRVIVMILISYGWGAEMIGEEQHPVIHYGLGMVVFVFAFLTLFVIDGVMRRFFSSDDATETETVATGSPPENTAPAAATHHVAPGRCLLGFLLIAAGGIFACSSSSPAYLRSQRTVLSSASRERDIEEALPQKLPSPFRRTPPGSG